MRENSLVDVRGNKAHKANDASSPIDGMIARWLPLALICRNRLIFIEFQESVTERPTN